MKSDSSLFLLAPLSALHGVYCASIIHRSFSKSFYIHSHFDADLLIFICTHFMLDLSLTSTSPLSGMAYLFLYSTTSCRPGMAYLSANHVVLFANPFLLILSLSSLSL